MARESPKGLLEKDKWLTGGKALDELGKGNKDADQAIREIEAGYLDVADDFPWYHVLIHPKHQVGTFQQIKGTQKPWILFDIQFRNRWSSRILVVGVSFWAGDPAWAPVKALGWSSLPENGGKTWHEWFLAYERQAWHLEVWREHAMIYQHTARTLSALWDGAASHLPIWRWLRLNRAHRAVELIHLTLLQGMADRADVASHVDERVSRIERLEHLADEQFAETLGWAGRGLREALDDASHFTTLRRLGTRTRDLADRATEQYKNLLEAMAHAFDERRVRELEVLQRAGFWLSAALGAFAVLTFMDFFMNVDQWNVTEVFMETTKGRSTGLKPHTWAILAVLGAGVMGSWAYSVWLRRMGSAWFHRTFRMLERYLTLSSTRELELLRTGITVPALWRWPTTTWRLSSVRGLRRMRLDAAASREKNPQEHDHDQAGEIWQQRDQELAGRFARLWDAAALAAERGSWRRPRVPYQVEWNRWWAWLAAPWVAIWGQWWTSRDLARQRRHIEALIVRTLLLAERTPMLRRYPLPRLALLHRHCGRLPFNWFGHFDGVSRTELRLVFLAARLPIEKADEIDRKAMERIAYTKALLAGRAGEQTGKQDRKIVTARDLLDLIDDELASPRGLVSGARKV
ncbi:hypothetical protein [Microbispora sp. NPDC049633]|uniref:hypothetical protein n=1 Tax=Microbispora sp. NPDC049633 TaxID=3154355 RepID=UPI00344A4810